MTEHGAIGPLDRERFRGALLGLAVGDALGTTVEFKPRGSFSPVTDIVGGGPFGLPAGAWTDDTSMALCLGESLLARAGFDPVDQLTRYLAWYRNGRWSSTGRCFDIGTATRAALERFEITGEPFPGDAAPNAAGNGPLMKLAPLPMAYASHPQAAIAFAGDSARTTHGAPQALDAARYFAGLIVGALQGATISQLLHQGVFEPRTGLAAPASLHPEVLAVAKGSFLSKEPPQIRGTGYIVAALEAAMWALASTRTFEDGALAATNLGDDADTTAAIYGQLAGAYYGLEGIPQRWRDVVHRGPEIIEMADALHALAATIDPSAPLAPVTPDDGAPASKGAAQSAENRSRGSLPGDAYWVHEGRLLAGPYPGAPTRAQASQKLDAFLELGVTCFIDLTEEGEGPGASGLHPYSALLRMLAHTRGIAVTHLRLPIRDVNVPTDWQMRAILAAVDGALAAGEVVYVHCWGGVGRTGTVIGCHLVEHGTAPDRVLEHLRTLRAGTARARRASPETDAQREMIAAWAASQQAGGNSAGREFLGPNARSFGPGQHRLQFRTPVGADRQKLYDRVAGVLLRGVRDGVLVSALMAHPAEPIADDPSVETQTFTLHLLVRDGHPDAPSDIDREYERLGQLTLEALDAAGKPGSYPE